MFFVSVSRSIVLAQKINTNITTQLYFENVINNLSSKEVPLYQSLKVLCILNAQFLRKLLPKGDIIDESVLFSRKLLAD